MQTVSVITGVRHNETVGATLPARAEALEQFRNGRSISAVFAAIGLPDIWARIDFWILSKASIDLLKVKQQKGPFAMQYQGRPRRYCSMTLRLSDTCLNPLSSHKLQETRISFNLDDNTGKTVTDTQK